MLANASWKPSLTALPYASIHLRRYFAFSHITHHPFFGACAETAGSDVLIRAHVL